METQANNLRATLDAIQDGTATEVADTSESQETSTENQEVNENSENEGSENEQDSDDSQNIDDSSVSNEKDDTIVEKEKIDDPEADTKAHKNEDQKYQVKVNGKTYEATADQLIEWAQKGMGAQEKFVEASKIRKQAETIINALKENPMSILEHPELGLDQEKVIAAMEEKLAERYLYEQMSEQEKHYYNQKQELEKYKTLEQQRKEQEEKARLEQEKQRYVQEYDQKFTQALQEVEIPKNENSIARMASYIQKGLSQGINVEPRDAALLVKEDLHNEMRYILKQLPPEKAEAILGKEVAQKIRKYDTSKIKNNISRKKPEEQAQESGEQKFKSFKDFNAYLDSF